MSGYTKLFHSIVTSTIWSEDDRTRIVWVTMLAMANRHGEVEASIPGLAKLAGVPVDAAEIAIKKLASPDPYSRTKDHDGRRIEAIDGGWQILNHQKYREKASEEDRREQDRIRKQRLRASASVRTCPQVSASVRKCPIRVRFVRTSRCRSRSRCKDQRRERRIRAVPSPSRS